jgi:hypothetical protein
MKIISKFQDYYDIGLAYGIDPKCIYLRETIDIPKLEETVNKYDNGYKNNAILPLNDWSFIFWDKRILRKYFSIPVAYVIFCGKMYFGFKVEDKWYWNFESFDKTMMSLKDKEIVNYYNSKSYRFDKKTRREKFRDAFDKAIKTSTENSKVWENINIENNSPIVLVEHITYRARTTLSLTTFVKNPCLKDYNFASAVDPYTAFQEISMYFTNILGIPENTMVEISDKDKIAERGFNEKSFRNPIREKDL